MNKYFYDCKTLEQGKAKYRHLAKKLHPDMGGSADSMAELTRQWEKFQKEISEPKQTYEGAFKQHYKDYGSTAYEFVYRPPNPEGNFYQNNPNSREDIYLLYEELNIRFMSLDARYKSVKNAYENAFISLENQKLHNQSLENSIKNLQEKLDLLLKENADLQKKLQKKKRSTKKLKPS